MAKRHVAISLTVVPSDVAGTNPKIIMEGGSLSKDHALVPADTISFHDGEPFMQLHKGWKPFPGLCGTSLIQLKWFDEIKDLRDIACKRVYIAAIAEQGSDRMSKRKLSQSVALPSTVCVQLELPDGVIYQLVVLFSSDFRQQVSFKLNEESLNNVVACIRANPDKGTRHGKPKRNVRFISQYNEVHLSAARDSLFVVWSDMDGMCHRKARKPWKAGHKPVDHDDATAALHEAAYWLHEFYKDQHKGPADLILPPGMCVDADVDDADGGVRLGAASEQHGEADASSDAESQLECD
jgi:hypothetical protein